MEPGTIANIALSLLFVALAMLVFFLLLKRYSSNFTQPEQDKIRIIAQRRMALKIAAATNRDRYPYVSDSSLWRKYRPHLDYDS